MTDRIELRIEDVSYHYGSFPAVDQVGFEVREGELVTLLGPSGSGKSTILRLIAGLLRPSTGRVVIGGEDATHLPPQQRNVGFVFQQYALFRHMTVFDNVAFGLRVRKWSKDRIADRVAELLRMGQLQGEEHKRPAQLSGGQRQRVALARALAPTPQVLLLDEPFGAVDAKVRLELRECVTSVFVTHDQEEALELSDRLVVLDHGRVEQIGTPDEIYEHPATPFVTGFIGPVNQLLGEAGDGVAQAGGFTVPAAWANGSGSPALVMIRPGDITLLPGDTATVRRLVHIGDLAKVELMTADEQLLTVHCSKQRAAELALQPGVKVGMELTRGWAYPR